MSRLFILLWLACGSQLFAQLPQMRVDGKPEKKQAEIVAVKDVNGRYCAAIQLQSNLEGLSYDSNNGVVRVDRNPGEDMVYLSPDERTLKIFKSGYQPLQIILSEVGLKLNSREVWLLRVTGEAETMPVNIVVEPRDAKILIDGEAAGPGPTYRIGIGKHRLQITHPQYESVDEEIRVAEDKTYFSHALKRRESAILKIDTQPTGAELWLDGKLIGASPYQGLALSGSHVLEAKKDLYLNTRREISVLAGRKNEISLRLKANFGYLRITSTPPGAEILIDGKALSPGSQPLKLKAGLHTFAARKPKHNPVKRDINLLVGETKTIDLSPQARTGSLAVFVNTDGARDARVVIDGRDYGAAPQMIKDLFEGRHTLELRKPNYLPHREEFTVAFNREQTIRADMITYTGSVQAKRDNWGRKRNWTIVGAALFAGAGVGFKMLADKKYDVYKSAPTTHIATNSRKSTENFDRYSTGAFISAGVFGVWTLFNQSRKSSVKAPRDGLSLDYDVSNKKLALQVKF